MRIAKNPMPKVEYKVDIFPRLKHVGICQGITAADVWETDPRITYKRLWDSINAERGHSWESNPWVWVVSFKMVKP